MLPTLRRTPLLLAVALALAVPSQAFAWGSQTHRYIARNYSQHLPPQMDGLRAYDGTVISLVNDPDIRRPTTPGEGPRHFIDIDRYPEFSTGTLSHDRAVLEAQYGAAYVLDTGIVPWAVGEVVTTLTQQFAAGQWSNAIVSIADLCHYVGDASQPLHCTVNFDGQLTGNNGIHSRYESTMMNAHIAELSTPAAAAEFHASPVDAMFDLVGDSWAYVSPLLAADNSARAASGGSYNTTYYNALWSATQTFTRARVDAATLMTASLVHTAWWNAGRPIVPGSSLGVEPAAASARLEASPLPFTRELTVRYDGAGPFTVDVHDVRGVRVARLVEGAASAGTVSWSPPASTRSGVFFVRLTTPHGSHVRRVIRLD